MNRIRSDNILVVVSPPNLFLVLRNLSEYSSCQKIIEHEFLSQDDPSKFPLLAHMCKDFPERDRF